jgi:hypothetical protein
MRIKSAFFIFVFTTLVSSMLAVSYAANKERVVNVSIVQLLVAPKKYEGKLVSVRGYVHLEFEGNAIYLHKDDYDHNIKANGLWVNVPQCEHPDGSTFQTGYADITGRFTAKFHGHMGLWPGSIQGNCYHYPP